MSLGRKKFPPIRMSHGEASVEIYGNGDGTATIRNLYSKVRGRGYATGLMQEVIAFADANGLILRLEAKRYGDAHGLDKEQLIRFYEKFGFYKTSKILRTTYMRRDWKPDV